MNRRVVAALMPAMLLVLVAGLLVACTPQDKSITSFDQLNQPGILVGVSTDAKESAMAAEEFPQAELVYNNDLMGSLTSVAQGKIDAYVCNRLNIELAIYNGMQGIRLLDETVGEGFLAAAAISPKTEIPDLKDKINEFLKQVKDDGTLDDMRERWAVKRELVMPDIPEAVNPTYHLVVGTSGISEPFSCYVNGELAGYDVELAKRFASWLGASIEFKIYDYDGIVPAALAGDVDCVFANLYVTPERQEAIEFSDPTFVVSIGVAVRDASAAEGGLVGFFDSVKESFRKTFIVENRWQLFAEGIGTTLLISVLSIVFGTLVGFAAYMICRGGSRIANTVTRFCIWLIEGMPIVVLLISDRWG